MLSFQNPGIIDPKAYTLMGASVKTGSNPIGFFGTGLKYAIAVFLREGCTIKLYRGLECTEFTSKLTDFRGTAFRTVYAGDRELAFTTDYGKKWEPWQAMRELWCNAMDEGGVADDSPHTPQEGFTTIHIEGPATDRAWKEKDKVFFKSTPFCEIDGIEVTDKTSHFVYFKGVRVFDLPHPTKFTYNFVSESLELSEDRTVKYEFLFKSRLAAKALRATNPDFIKAFIETDERFYEYYLNCEDDTPSEEFLKTLVSYDKYLFRSNPSLQKLLFKHKALNEVLVEVEATQVEKVMLSRAKAACRTLGVFVDRYPIVITEGLENGILALADRKDQRIYLSRALFQRGTKYVALGLYEEYLHIAENLDDNSRELQTFLLEKIFVLVEELKGEPL